MIVERLTDYGRSFRSLLGERRKSQRQDFNCSVTVSCKNGYGQIKTHSCQCLNVSNAGMGIESPDPIPDNSDIYIHSETHNLKKFARVHHSRRQGARTILGCSFQHAPEYWN